MKIKKNMVALLFKINLLAFAVGFLSLIASLALDDLIEMSALVSALVFTIFLVGFALMIWRESDYIKSVLTSGNLTLVLALVLVCSLAVSVAASVIFTVFTNFN